MLSYTHSLPYGCSDNHIWFRASRYILIPIEGRIVIVVSPCPVIWLYAYPVVSSPFPSGSVTGWIQIFWISF
uniref:hypothetical protein n=1 Tax=Bacteroides finegoldii TaxID=338188 RepID=UPI0035659A39